VANLAGWNVASLTLVPPRGFTGTLALQVRSIGNESSNGMTRLDGSPYVSFTAATDTSTPKVTSATPPQIVVGPMAREAAMLTFSVAPAPRTSRNEEDANHACSSVLGEESLRELEQFAKASWLGVMG